jgi:hypothetical protein
VLIAAPDRAGAGRLCTALDPLEPKLRRTHSGYDVAVALKSPNPGVVLTAIISTVQQWLETHQLHSTTITAGDQPPTTITPSRRLATAPASAPPRPPSATLNRSRWVVERRQVLPTT